MENHKTVKKIGRPKKNPEDLKKYKFIAINWDDYLILKEFCKKEDRRILDVAGEFIKTLV